MDVENRLRVLVADVTALSRTYRAIGREDVVTNKARETVSRCIDAAQKTVNASQLLLDTLYPGDWEKRKKARMAYLVPAKEDGGHVLDDDYTFVELHTSEGELSKECPSLDRLDSNDDTVL